MYKNGLGKRGDVWHYQFRLAGRLYRGSCHTSNKTDAILVLAERQREAGRAAAGIEGGDLTVGAAYQGWLEEAQGKQRSEKHLASAARAAQAFGLIFAVKIKDLSTNQVEECRKNYLASGYSTYTTNVMLGYLKSWLNWAVKTGAVHQYKCLIEQPKVQKRRLPTIPPDRVLEYLEVYDRVTQSRSKRLAVRCVLGLGLREAELREMRWEDFTGDGAGSWTYWPGKTKSRNTRAIPVPKWLWSLLSRGYRTEGLVFPAEDGAPHRPGWLERNVRAAGVAIGIPGGIGVHRLRASFATLHSWAQTPLAEIQAMLGHADVRTTMIYVGTSTQAQRAQQDGLGEKVGLDKSTHIVHSTPKTTSKRKKKG